MRPKYKSGSPGYCFNPNLGFAGMAKKWAGPHGYQARKAEMMMVSFFHLVSRHIAIRARGQNLAYFLLSTSCWKEGGGKNVNVIPSITCARNTPSPRFGENDAVSNLLLSLLFFCSAFVCFSPLCDKRHATTEEAVQTRPLCSMHVKQLFIGKRYVNGENQTD